MNELSESVKKLRSKKLFDNFTQTVPHIDSVNSCNKFTQTDELKERKTSEDIDTQTVEKVTRHILTQTDVTATDVKNVEIQTAQTELSNEPAEKEQSIKEIVAKNKENLLNKRFFNKNLAYRDNRDDLNRLFSSKQTSEISNKGFVV